MAAAKDLVLTQYLLLIPSLFVPLNRLSPSVVLWTSVLDPNSPITSSLDTPGHAFIRRSFELISLYYIAPVTTLNAFLAPFLLDSKPDASHSQSKSKSDSSKSRLKHDERWPKRIIAPDNVASVRVKRQAGSGVDSEKAEEKEESVSLEDFVRRHVSSLFADWDSTWWLDR